MFVSITRLRVRSVWFLPGFIFYALRSSKQARSAPGNLGVGLLRDANSTYWTRTAWLDEAALRAFMMAMPHRGVMGKLAEWCDEASVIHWNQETAELPDWHDAHRRMVQEGRPSRVRHPSAAHQALRFPPPKT
jgi:hypothetical protein